MSNSIESIIATNLFMGFCVLDLIAGNLFYPSQLRYLEGYVHHIFYIIMLSIFKYFEMTNAFFVFATCEIPTFLIALGIILEKKFIRANIVTFGLFRIIIFMYFSLKFLLVSPWLIKIIASIPVFGITIAHVNWFLKLII